jgi:nickel transport protein
MRRWIAVLALVTTSAGAHEYWIEKGDGGYTLFQGHVFSTHEGEARVQYDPAIVKRVTCAGGAAASPEPGKTYPVRIAGRCAALLVDIVSGYWTQTLTDTVPKPRSEVRGALRGWKSEESIKRLDNWSAAAMKPLSDGLEIVPLENPFLLKPGDKLRVQVLWQGKPRKGVAVAYAGDTRGQTDSQGEVNLRIRRGGVQMVAASFDEPIKDPLADRIVHGAMLQFELPQ